MSSTQSVYAEIGPDSLSGDILKINRKIFTKVTNLSELNKCFKKIWLPAPNEQYSKGMKRSLYFKKKFSIFCHCFLNSTMSTPVCKKSVQPAEDFEALEFGDTWESPLATSPIIYRAACMNTSVPRRSPLSLLSPSLLNAFLCILVMQRKSCSKITSHVFY